MSELENQVTEIKQALIRELRYTPYQIIIKGVDPKLHFILNICPVHQETYFSRIGETDIFKCSHNDHNGGISHPEFNRDTPSRDIYPSF